MLFHFKISFFAWYTSPYINVESYLKFAHLEYYEIIMKLLVSKRKIILYFSKFLSAYIPKSMVNMQKMLERFIAFKHKAKIHIK